LVETDAPYLTPVPHRGKPNEPAFVPLVGAAIAAVKALAPQLIAEASTVAATEVFGLH
jgi:TatD DNase family protein